MSRQLNLIQTTSIYFSFCQTMIWQNFFSELDAYVQVDTCNHGIVFHRAQCALHSCLQYEETRNLGSQTFYYLAIFHSHSMLGYVSPIPGRKRVRPVFFTPFHDTFWSILQLSVRLCILQTTGYPLLTPISRFPRRFDQRSLRYPFLRKL